MCWVQDNCEKETDTMYCLEWWFQTDIRLSNRYLFGTKQRKRRGTGTTLHLIYLSKLGDGLTTIILHLVFSIYLLSHIHV